MPWGLWWVGLRLNGTEGAQTCPYPWSQRAGYITWEPSRLPGLQWVGKRPPLLSYAPRTNVAGGMGAPWRALDRPGSSAGSPCLSGWGKRPLLLYFSSWRAPPACLSWSPRPKELKKKRKMISLLTYWPFQVFFITLFSSRLPFGIFLLS